MTHMNSYEQPLDFWVLVPQTNLDGCWNSPRKYPRYGSSSDRELMIFDTLRWNGVPIRWNSYVKFRGQKDHRFSAAWPVVCLSVSLWGILSPCLSERGWIARARHSESRRYMMVKQVGSPQKPIHPPFRMSPDNFSRSAAFIFSQATIFSPSCWFFHPYFPANKLCIFHVFPHIFPKKIRRFSRSAVACTTGVAPRRGPRQGPGKGRRSSPSGRGASADSLGGASGAPGASGGVRIGWPGGWGKRLFWSCGWDFNQILIGDEKGISEIRENNRSQPSIFEGWSWEKMETFR